MTAARPPAARGRWRGSASWRRLGRGCAIALLALSLGLAALRLYGPEVGLLLAPLGFVVLGLPAALLGAALAAACLRRSARLAAVAAAVGALVLHASWIAPLYVGQVPDPDPRCAITVLSQNLEYGDGEALARYVVREHVDVLVVVEAGRQRLDAVIDGLAGELPVVVGAGRGQPDDTVVLSRFPVLETSASRDARSRRVRLDVPCLGPLDVVAAHPSPPPGVAYPMHVRALDQLVTEQLGPGLAGGTTRAVLAGDLNSTLDYPVLRRMQELGLRDAAELVNAGWRPTYPAPGTTRRLGVAWPPIVAIDHVLVSPGLAVSDFATVPLPQADHLGVRAVVHPVRPAPGG